MLELDLLRINLENFPLSDGDSYVFDPLGQPFPIVATSTLVVEISGQRVSFPASEICSIRVDQPILAR